MDKRPPQPLEKQAHARTASLSALGQVGPTRRNGQSIDSRRCTSFGPFPQSLVHASANLFWVAALPGFAS